MPPWLSGLHRGQWMYRKPTFASTTNINPSAKHRRPPYGQFDSGNTAFIGKKSIVDKASAGSRQ